MCYILTRKGRTMPEGVWWSEDENQDLSLDTFDIHATEPGPEREQLKSAFAERHKGIALWDDSCAETGEF